MEPNFKQACVQASFESQAAEMDANAPVEHPRQTATKTRPNAVVANVPFEPKKLWSYQRLARTVHTSTMHSDDQRQGCGKSAHTNLYEALY